MEIPLRCKCGLMRGKVVKFSLRRVNRSICLCRDCQAYAHFLGRATDILDQNGGTDICPISPAQLKITQGPENLKLMRLSSKGMLRWYAGCCNTPIGNSAPSRRVPFLGLVHSFIDDGGDLQKRSQLIGPVKGRLFGKDGIPPLPDGTPEKVPLRLMLGAMRLILTGFLRGAHSPSPFFNEETDEPKVMATILSKAEREKYTPGPVSKISK